MFNQFTGIGHITKEVTLKSSEGKTDVATTSLAINDSYVKNGQTVEETLFIDVVFFGKLATVVKKTCKKRF